MQTIDIDKWVEYNLCDLFDITRGKRLRSADHKIGNIKYFSTTSENNGISTYISNPIFIEENDLIFNTFGNVFYSESKFSGSDEIKYIEK